MLNNVKSFALLILLIKEIPIKSEVEVLDDIPQLYKVVLWFAFQKSHFTTKHHQTDFDSTVLKINEDEIIDFINSLDTIDQICNLLTVTINVQQKFDYLISDYFNEGIFKLSNSQRIELIQDCLQEKDLDKDKIVKILYNRIPEKYFMSLTKILIPRLIQPDEISSNSIRIFDNFLNINDYKLQNELYEYVGCFASSNQVVKLFLDGYIDSIELSKVIAGFNSIAIDEQPNLLRRIFYLLHANIISSTDYFFEQIILLLSKSKLNTNVRICLKVLESLIQSNSYVGENILSDIVCKYVNDDSQEIIQIDDLIEKCKGRIWMTKGEQERNWYLTVKGKNFPVNDDSLVLGNDYYKFDRDKRTIVIDGKNYPFKWYKEERDIFLKKFEIPDGIIFCDAQKSEIDSTIEKQFYWCNNSKCFAPCQNDHLDFEWRDYTLRDFIKILNIPFDNDSYYRFVSVVNRANRLLKKLQCTSCHKLLRDSKSSEFAFYRVTTFHCTNPECEEFHKVVYLNHCLNWRCLNVVDSRVSEKCPNEWYICDKCDSCCSQKKIENRYSNLLTNDAYNPSNLRHQKLKLQVDNKLGHLEKGEVYDYKTGLLKNNSKLNEKVHNDKGSPI